MPTTPIIQFADPIELDAHDREELARFIGDFLPVNASEFSARIEKSTRVILFRDPQRFHLVGTALLRVVDVEHDGRSVRALHLSHVVLEHAWRHQGLVERATARVFLEFGLFTTRELYWFGAADTCETYRRAVQALPEAFPRADVETPKFESSLSARLSKALFGEAWLESLGLVCPEVPVVEARPTRAVELADAHFRHFRKLNPRAHRGHALPVLARMSVLTFGLVLGRMFRRWWGAAKPLDAAPVSIRG